ncbi:MAG: GAF domain-containing protein [Microscillaceae bacterium]|nr:GAF domain-containing protein [Microscillaceae bacterium]
MRRALQKYRSRLQLYSLTLILLAAGLGLMFFVHSQRLEAYQAYQKQFNQLLRQIDLIHQHEQAFLGQGSQDARYLKTGESKSLDLFARSYQRCLQHQDELLNNSLAYRLGIVANLLDFKTRLQAYHKSFTLLSQKIKLRGNEQAGLIGKVQTAIQELHTIDSLYLASVLTLRKHEKDFLLKKDLTHIEALKSEAERLILKNQLSVKPDDTLAQARVLTIVQGIENYVHTIERLVKTERLIGLDNQSGLLGRIKKEYARMSHQTEYLALYLPSQLQGLAQQSRSLVWTVFLVVLLIAIILSVLVSFMESAPIEGLNRIAASLRLGVRNQDQLLNHRNFRRKDEIGSLAYHFQFVIQNLRNALSQVKEKDARLQEVAQQDALRQWHSEGMRLFGEIFRKNHRELEQQTFEIIAELVKYTKSVQGGLFVKHESPEGMPFLELSACYAYERKKYQKKQIALGEGLVGSAWKENRTLLITDIPPNYTHIASVLGRAEPNTLLLVPIRIEEEVNGVLELVSFKPYQPHEVEFIESLAKRIGGALISVQAEEKARMLIEASENMAQEAQAREAELQEQLKSYQYWLEQFEQRLKSLTERTDIYQAILSKVYRGVIITNEKFRIILVNDYILKRFNYREEDLQEKPLEVLLETDYDNILDLRERKFKLNFESFEQNIPGKIIDRRGKAVDIETVSGKLDIEEGLVYVFLLNEQEQDGGLRSQSPNATGTPPKLKVAS